MKKFSMFFVVMAIAMFVFVFTAFAQDAALPAIDETAAADYLGTWYLKEMCSEGECMDLSVYGETEVIELNADNTFVNFSEEEPEILSWYMEDGAAYVIIPAMEETEYTEATEEITLAIEITDGNLVMDYGEISVVYVRELPPAIGSGNIIEDATIDDFAGDWYFYGSIDDEGTIMPLYMFGMSSSINITDGLANSPNLFSEENVPVEVSDGVAVITVQDINEEGETVEITVSMLVQDDDTLIMAIPFDDEEVSYMIYVRDEELVSGPALFEGLSFDGEGEIEMSEEELEALLAQLEAELGEDGENLDSLLENINLEELLQDVNWEELLQNVNVEELLQNVNVEELLQNVNVEELLKDVDLKGIASGFADENGEYSVDSVLSGIGGLLGGSGK